MSRFTLGVIGTAIVLTIGTILGSFIWAAVLLLSVAAVYLIFWYQDARSVGVSEVEYGVVFERYGDNFVRFLPPGDHKLDLLHEKMTATIKAGQSTDGEVEKVRTKEGLPLDIEWFTFFNLDPMQLEGDLRFKMARALPENAANMVAGRVKQVLRHIIGEYTLADLCAEGIHIELEEKLKDQLQNQLGILSFKFGRVAIHAIHKPARVMAALEAVYRREREIEVLRQLREVISGYTDEDMKHLTELERINVVGRNGGSVLYSHTRVSDKPPIGPLPPAKLTS